MNSRLSPFFEEILVLVLAIVMAYLGVRVFKQGRGNRNFGRALQGALFFVMALFLALPSVIHVLSTFFQGTPPCLFRHSTVVWWASVFLEVFFGLGFAIMAIWAPLWATWKLARPRTSEALEKNKALEKEESVSLKKMGKIFLKAFAFVATVVWSVGAYFGIARFLMEASRILQKVPACLR